MTQTDTIRSSDAVPCVPRPSAPALATLAAAPPPAPPSATIPAPTVPTPAAAPAAPAASSHDASPGEATEVAHSSASLEAAPALTLATDVQMGPLDRARDRVGRAIRGKWRLDSLLGCGGTAAVYAATHRNRSKAAVKMLHAELSAQPSIRGCFLREGYAANGVPHDGVVRVIDDDIAEDGSVFLVMELLEGQTLKDKLDEAKGPLAMDESMKIIDRVLDVLAAAHAQGIQHRDITPKNVFLQRDGGNATPKVKIIDFGSAFVAELSQQSGVTLSGLPMGTPAYMSPELARGRFTDVDPRSDVFACGALLFTMLTGKSPRRADTVPEELLAAMTDPIPSLATVRAELPKSVIELVDRALSFEKTDRWPGARAMQDALILAREGISSAPDAVAEVVGAGPFDPDSWDDPGPTVQAIMPYGAGPPEMAMQLVTAPQPDMAPPPAPFGMNPLFVGAETSMPPVARSMRPPMASYAPPTRPQNLLAPLLVGGLLVLTVLAGLALLLVDRDTFPRSSAAAPKTTAVAALPPSPPRVEDPIPPPPALPDPPPPAPPPPATAAADKPAAAPVVVRAATSAPSSSAARSRRPAPSSDPIVRTNPFDRRD